MENELAKNVGRPTIPAINKHVKISISIPPDVNRKLEKYCEEHGASKSKVTAIALDYFLFCNR